MNPIVLVVLAVVIALRIGLRWRRRTSRSVGAGVSRLSGLGGDTGLVAGREVRERVRARSFRVVTVVLLMVVAAAIIVPILTRGKSRPQRVGLVGGPTVSQQAAILGAAKAIGTKAVLVPEADVTAAGSDLHSGRIDLAVIGTERVLAVHAVSATEATATARLAYAIAAALGVDKAFSEAGLSPEQAARLSGAKPLPVAGLEPSTSKPGLQGTSVIGIILIFIMLTQYETWTLIGVMEEKSSRVVEVLLATVSPLQLLGGKVLGIGLVAMVQASGLLAFALVLAKLVGSDLLKGTAPAMLAAALLWLVVGYAFYCWVYAAAGSLAERQDQIQTLALPLSIPMILGYVMALTAAASGHASAFFQVLAYLPPTAPFAMPTLIGLGAASWWQFAASVAISLATTVVVARLAAVIYRRAVLRTGRRVRVREIFASASR